MLEYLRVDAWIRIRYYLFHFAPWFFSTNFRSTIFWRFQLQDLLKVLPGVTAWKIKEFVLFPITYLIYFSASPFLISDEMAWHLRLWFVICSMKLSYANKFYCWCSGMQIKPYYYCFLILKSISLNLRYLSFWRIYCG